MKDAPVERKIEEFHLKGIDKDKLYKFLREKSECMQRSLV